MQRRFLAAIASVVWAAAGLIAAAHADTVLLGAAAYPEGPLWRDGKLLYVEYAGPGVADGANTLYITGVFDPWKAPFPGAVYRWTK